MKFGYKKYGPGIFRPVIPIEVIYNGTAVPYEVLVDSGADICIFDAQIAEILGLLLQHPHIAVVMVIMVNCSYGHPIKISGTQHGYDCL